MEKPLASEKKIHKLQKEIDTLKSELEKKDALIEYYLSQFRLLQEKRFGQSSEQHLVSGEYEQISLFNEAEALVEPEKSEESIEEMTYTRRKRKGKGSIQELSSLVTETIDHRLSEEASHCEACGSALRAFDSQSRYELKIIPAQVEVLEHLEHRYVCDTCEKTATESHFVQGPKHKRFLPQSVSSPETLAWLIEQKYRMHLPLYRLEQQLEEQMGLNLSRQTMSNWLLQSNTHYVSRMMEHFKGKLSEMRHLHADETTLTVLHEPGRSAIQKSYMWLYLSGRDEIPIALYDYQTTRANKHPQHYLKDFHGDLQVDGYSGYNVLQSQGICLSGCWAHARRKYADVLKALPKELSLDSLAGEAIKKITQLYRIEEELKKAYPRWGPEAKAATALARKEKSTPLVEAYFAWVKEQKPLARGALKGALDYSLNEEKKLRCYLSNPNLEIDNNRAERGIKPFVMGRKNWLFSNTARGAEASANLYSLVETVRANGLKLYDYLCYLFKQMMEKPDDIEYLMPWSSTLPLELRIQPI